MAPPPDRVLSPSVVPTTPLSNASLPSPSSPFSNPSDFLLLTSNADNTPSDRITLLPRPRLLPLLQAAAICDLVWALFAIPLARQLESGVLVGLVWSCVRPVLIFGIVTSARVRERGYLVLAQLMVSFLVTLYHVNELVQRKDVSFLVSPPQSSSRLQADNAAPSLAGTPSPINALTVAFNSATTFYFGSFAFSLLHYILFALVIGIRRRRNPFANRRVSGFRGSTWGEQGWEGVEELVRPDDELSDGGEGDVGAEGDELLDDDEDASSSEDDEDDIVDVARPSLRSRASRASMWTAGGHEESPHRGGDESDSGSTLPRSRSRQAGLQDSGLRNSSKYGSIHSLAGI